MRIGSKVAIKSCEKVTNGDQTFYKAVVVEQIYNSRSPYKWDFIQTKCQIFTDLELKEANWDLENSKIRYSFKNISNQSESVFVVNDFIYEKQSAWKNGIQLRNNLNVPIFNEIVKITSLGKSNDSIIKQKDNEISKLNHKIDKLNKKINTYKDKIKLEVEKVKSEYREKIKVLNSKILSLNKKLVSRESEILSKNEKINKVEMDYNPRFKSNKVLPTESDMVEFEDI